MQEQEQVEICKNVLNAIYALYNARDEDADIPEVVTKDKKYLEALDILVFNGYLTTADNLRFNITELGVGAVLYGFENAEKILANELL